MGLASLRWVNAGMLELKNTGSILLKLYQSENLRDWRPVENAELMPGASRMEAVSREAHLQFFRLAPGE